MNPNENEPTPPLTDEEREHRRVRYAQYWASKRVAEEAAVWHRILAEATPESIVRYERRTAWLGGEFPTDGIGFEIGDVTFFVPELVSVYDILPPSPNKGRTEIFMDDLRLDIDNY